MKILIINRRQHDHELGAICMVAGHPVFNPDLSVESVNKRLNQAQSEAFALSLRILAMGLVEQFVFHARQVCPARYLPL